jgi:hypothetical protein
MGSQKTTGGEEMKREEFKSLVENLDVDRLRRFVMNASDFHKIKHTESFLMMIFKMAEVKQELLEARERLEKLEAFVSRFIDECDFRYKIQGSHGTFEAHYRRAKQLQEDRK